MVFSLDFLKIHGSLYSLKHITDNTFTLGVSGLGRDYRGLDSGVGEGASQGTGVKRRLPVVSETLRKTWYEGKEDGVLWV